MKCHIAGSRKSWREPGEFEWIGIDLDLEALPRVGDHMILDGGSVYEVERCMWFVNTVPEVGIAAGDKKGSGELDVVHIDIKPHKPHEPEQAPKPADSEVRQMELNSARLDAERAQRRLAAALASTRETEG